VIDYIREKYGHSKVSQMVTFGRLQGRSALKEVLSMNEACGFDEMNSITKSLPPEQEISDQLASMDSPSVIQWTLMNQPDSLRDYCRLNDDGSLEGDYSKLFEQAMRLEGTFKSQGKHAAGVVISSNNLNEVCPMVRDKTNTDKIAGLEMNDLESMGHVKFDVLGISLLDKVMGIRDDLEQQDD
jgi:DNA polymerase-3 subunit alpha